MGLALLEHIIIPFHQFSKSILLRKLIDLSVYDD